MGKTTKYQTLIDKLGMTQSGAARFLNVAGKSSRRWASGDIPDVPAANMMLLALMAHLKIAPDKVRKLAGLPPVNVGDMRYSAIDEG
jgi:hypothetical protein